MSEQDRQPSAEQVRSAPSLSGVIGRGTIEPKAR